MAIGILEDAPRGVVIKSEFTNCDLIALMWEIKELAHHIDEIDRADDPLQLRAIRRLMDLEIDATIPREARERIAAVRQLLEHALANDYLDDEYRRSLEKAADRAEEILKEGNRMLEALLAKRRRKARRREGDG